ELKRRMKKEECTFTKMCGCYVDSHKNIILHINETFLNLVDEEFFKYLEIAKKTLSGTIGNNVLELEFNPEEENPGGKQNFLLGLRDSGLKADALLDRLYELIIENYEYDGNYLILLFHDAYDVVTKTKDDLKIDESEEVYDYIICSICPVELTKAGLGYRQDENRIGARIRDWVVSPPDNGFVFPAFSDRSSDIHSLMYYTRNPKEPHTELMEAALGCKAKRTATIEKKTFEDILKSAIDTDEYDAEEIMVGIHQTLNSIVEENATSTSAAPTVFGKIAVESLKTNGIPEEIADKLEKACIEEFGSEPPIVENIVDVKAIDEYSQKQKEQKLQKEVAELKTKLEEVSSASLDLPWSSDDGTESIVLSVSPEKAEEIQAKIIDGKRCIVIPLDGGEQTFINGVNTEL
ncbi:MAG: DUF4317 domain-containing protein, partial [Clostridiales bacterium]|nr:DUF4317 domain-containing protein [Clostridiales bacterium]